MTTKTEEISIHNITRDDALQLIADIMKATKGDMAFKPDEYPMLRKLHKLLSGNFQSSKKDIHFL